MRFFDFFFYVLGVLFFFGTAHEIFHFINCGGEFVSGLAFIKGNWYVGSTWCKLNNGAGGEIIPTTLEILFYVVFIWGKIRFDKLAK